MAAFDEGTDEDDEQKSAMLLVDLAADDGCAGKNEPARFLARMRADGEEGRRRAQEVNAILAAAIIPALGLGR